MEKGISERGMEADSSREPKVKAMRRALELLRNSREDNFIERVEAELGPLSDWEWETDENGVLIDKDTPEQKNNNRAIFSAAMKLENKEWNELWNIFKGTRNSKQFDKKYDGSDMRGWWD